jgi:3-oxo-5alpha-steroid 4-dehydrogenase
MGDDGSGLELGNSVGGYTDLMERVCVARTIAPPNVFPAGIIVNDTGARFINEDAYAFIVGGAIAEQKGSKKAWLILEGPDFWKGFRQSAFPGKGLFVLWGLPALINILLGGTRRARRLSVLARKCGIDPKGLERTVKAYNEAASFKRPDPLGKFPGLIHPIVNGPFYAVNMSLNNKFAPAQCFTLGGLVVDELTGAVRRADGSLVEGLYAAGRVAVGLCSKGYMSGLSIADTVFSGRRAGRYAAEAVNSAQSATAVKVKADAAAADAAAADSKANAAADSAAKTDAPATDAEPDAAGSRDSCVKSARTRPRTRQRKASTRATRSRPPDA